MDVRKSTNIADAAGLSVPLSMPVNSIDLKQESAFIADGGV